MTFVNHGPGFKANNPYWTGTLSLADCQNSCKVDMLCGGIGFDSSSSECTISGRAQSKNAKTCPSCSFYHKQCGTGKRKQTDNSKLLEDFEESAS